MRNLLRRLSLLVVALALIAVLAPAGIVARAQGSKTYVVQPGDSLFSIASQFNVSVSLLATINRFYDVNTLYVGQVLTIPDAKLGAASGSAGGNFGTGGVTTNPAPQVPVYNAPIYTPPTVVYAPGTTVTTTTTYTAYVVKAGDFLSVIAERFQTTPQAIMSANAIADPNLVYVGQWLTIPRTATRISPQPRVYAVPQRSGNYYIVQPGDNLFGIAARTGRNAWSIARSNGILDLNAIYVGQPLLIP